MPENAISFKDQVADESSTLGEKLSDTAGHVKDKVAELGRATANKIDENRDAAASGLQQAASAFHENAESLPGGKKVSSLAHATAETLSSTADYVRDHDVKRMLADVETLVKNNPGRSLIAAAVIGFRSAAFHPSRNWSANISTIQQEWASEASLTSAGPETEVELGTC